ncbi:universal stress protein [Desulfobacterales bacterium HSG17]|nr:universal stress protein [Desulfobacterales bacterium HSG17]
MYKTILVPLDGSKRAEAIIPHVEELAVNYHAKIVILRVVERSYCMPDYYDRVNIASYQQEYERRKKDVEAYLAAWQGELREKGIESKIIVGQDQVVSSILNAATQENADLIAIASHGRTGLSRAFYGSVAAGVLNGADRPLLIIRSRQQN